MSSISKKAKKMKKQRGGNMKKNVHCVCSRNHHPMIQKGGKLLTPAQMKLIQRQHLDFRTLPVKTKQRGMGHCQCGGSFFGDLGSALTGAFHDPLRGLAAVATLGASEVIAVPADLLKRQTGVKASTVLDKAAPIIGAVAGPEGAMGSKFTSIGLKQIGLGKRR